MGDSATEQLASGEAARRPRRRAGRAAVAAAAVLVAIAVGITIALTRPQHAHPAGTPAPATSGPSTPTTSGEGGGLPARLGSVLIAPLAGCTRTDGRHRLTVAFEVTNLGIAPLRVIGALPVAAAPGLVLRTVHVGGRPCAPVPHPLPAQLPSRAAAVIAFGYRIRPGCPRADDIVARVTFTAGARVAHVDASRVADLQQLTFAGCA